MKKLLKIFGVVFGLMLVACLAVVIYITTLDPNDYKALIADKFRQETGRTLALDGNIAVSLYPWLGIEVNGVTVGNAPGFGEQPFFQAEHAMVRVKLMPLLRQQYEVDTVRLHGAMVNLARNEAGISNWADLVKGEPAESSGLPLAAVILGGVDIRDAGMVWDDRSTDVRYDITNLMMSTGELVYGQPVDVSLTLTAAANKPEIAADVELSGTVIYEPGRSAYSLSPLQLHTTLTGPNVPSGSADIDLVTSITVNLDNDTLSISGLDFNALGTHLTGTIYASNIQSPAPSYQTTLELTGNDLSVLFKVAEIEPLATQIAAMSNRSFDFSAALNADMQRGDLEISGLEANLLGANVRGDVRASNIQSSSPAVRGTLNAAGPDLPALLRVMGQLQGGAESPLAQLANQIAGLDRSFDVSASIDADMQSGNLNLSGLNASLLGANIRGDILATNIQSATPVVRGTLHGSGPDLPALMQVLGQFMGGADATMTQYGRQLGRVANRSFGINSRFDADLASGNIDVPVLVFEGLGFKVDGRLAANNMQQANGSINGQLTVAGSRMKEILAALEYSDLAEVLQSMNLAATISGSRNDLNINPVDLRLTLSGPTIPNSPVSLGMTANTRLNLERETLELEEFGVTGLGLNVTGKLNASNIMHSPAFNGEVNVPAFNLRRLMLQLNKELPETADSKVFERVAVSSSFEGSANHVNINRLALVLDDSNLDGTFSMTDFDQPVTEFDINIDRINADRYLPPESGEQARPVTPETAAGAAAQLPLETLRTFNSRGNLKVGQMIISKATLSDLVLSIDAKDGRINLSPVSANLYQGSYQGEISLDASADLPVLTFKSALQGVEIDPLLTDFMDASNVSGIGNMELAVTARGTDTDAFKRTLNGTGRIALEDGVLRGVDVAKVLTQVEIMIESKRVLEIDRGVETAFDTFSGTLQITDGVVMSNDLQIASPGFRVTGRGTVVNLNNDTINYNLVASADPGSATRGEERYNIGGYSIPIACQGSVNTPRCVPDVGEIIKVAVSREVERRLGDVLQRALGGDAPATQQQAAPSDSGDSESQQQQTEPGDPAQELINRALRSIFN